MRLDEKRTAIEILLCCGNEDAPIVRYLAVDDFDLDCDEAGRVRQFYVDSEPDVRDDDDHPYETACIEAAYRLIESSPTLIREFFHRSAP